MIRRATIALLASLPSLGCRSNAPHADADTAREAPSAKREDQVLAVCRAQEAAWNRGDIEGFLRAGYWQSDALTFFSGGDVTRGFEPMLERFRKRYASEGKEMGRLSFTELEPVALDGSWMCLRGRWALDFQQGDDVGGLFTLLLRETDSGWRIVHDHTSVGT